MSPVPALLLAALCVALPTADAAEPDPSDWTEFRATRGRFADRMQELVADTDSWIVLREQQEKSAIADSYDSLIGSLGALEVSRRDQAIEVMSEFLERNPTVPGASHVRFRLAELHFELAQERWMAEMDAWQSAVDALPEQALVPDPPKIDLRVPVALYQRIVADNAKVSEADRYDHLDGVQYMLAWCYKEPRANTHDLDAMADHLGVLVTGFPSSEFQEPAQLFLGDVAFDEGRLDDAVAHYETVVAADGEYAEEGSYQLAWALYRRSDTPVQYDAALTAFAAVMDLGDADYRPEALRYIGISLADPPARVGIPTKRAETRAGGIHEYAIE